MTEKLTLLILLLMTVVAGFSAGLVGIALYDLAMHRC